MKTIFVTGQLDDAIAELIYWDVDTSESTPDVEECKYIIEDKLAELKSLQDKLSSLPFDFCDGGLLRASIADSIERINWDGVYEKIKFFRMENP